MNFPYYSHLILLKVYQNQADSLWIKETLIIEVIFKTSTVRGGQPPIWGQYPNPAFFLELSQAKTSFFIHKCLVYEYLLFNKICIQLMFKGYLFLPKFTMCPYYICSLRKANKCRSIQVSADRQYIIVANTIFPTNPTNPSHPFLKKNLIPAYKTNFGNFPLK